MMMPTIVAGNPGGGAQDPVPDEPARFARRVHAELDSWMLGRMDAHLARFLASGEDTGWRIGYRVAPDLREAMHATWTDWRVAFEDDPAPLNHFLRLLVCAVDDDHDCDAAQILVAPMQFGAIARGTAVSLAVAAAWQTTAPKGGMPGNLFRRWDEAPEWTGHGCAAGLIDGTAMSLCAASYMWQTQFVILSVQGQSSSHAVRNAPSPESKRVSRRFSETDGSGSVMIWISRDFTDAVAAGTDQLAALLATLETRHFAALERAILKGSTA